MKPVADLSSAKAKNTTIRSSCLDQNGSRFITGSEDGLICIWSSSDEEQNKNIEENQNKLKAMKKLKINKKPYDE